MKDWTEYLYRLRRVLLLGAVCIGAMCAVFFLYELPLEPILYGTALCLLAGIAALFLGYRRYRAEKEKLSYIKESFPLNLSAFSQPEDGVEADYQELIKMLDEERQKLENNQSLFFTQLTDYYTMWVHQIKTPIASARLLLTCPPDEKKDGSNREEANNREVLAELFKIEEYVDMVLGYLRTEDISSDMNFVKCPLDGIIREQIHRFARIFIGKKLTLAYEGVDEAVLTDAKWLGFVIGQVLSNALKYTREGGISIYMAENQPQTLVIEDTGIGVRKEDLPRVFEKGFTGCNGRGGERSTGIGLYLCAKIMKKLGHGISMESQPGKGTKVYLSLGREEMELY